MTCTMLNNGSRLYNGRFGGVTFFVTLSRRACTSIYVTCWLAVVAAGIAAVYLIAP